jgi:serine/threonine protein kinase
MTPDGKSIGRIKEILSQALEFEAGRKREEFLDTACGHDDRLRREVESLLAAYGTADELLNRDASGEPLLDLPDLVGTMIGHYRLVECLGEGGFGEVYRAQQTEPFKREVALKIIKLGMDTKNVIARFEAERQALARMNHPNIAQVYDAGTTESGRPYFVMELVDGIPILQYCDRNRLSLKDRITLFRRVCEGVQHAHNKGILHRDLKPSNILVSEDGGKPLPKIIDFGVAKSLEGRLTEETLATLQEMLIGTPMYMSPEQLNHDQDTITERSDIYSLGVILYELVTGATPLEHTTPTSLTMANMRQALHTKDLPRPSRRFKALGRRTAVIANRRGVKPLELRRRLRGDLDWIVMKAIDIEPEHRYEDSVALANDLNSYLNSAPVSAGRPGIIRRTRKFFCRHKTTRYVIASVSLTVLAGAGIMTYSYFHLTKDPASLIEQRGWKLEKFYDMGELGSNGFGIRPDGSVLIVNEWGPMPKGLYWARKGGKASIADAFSLGEEYVDPEDAIELPEGIYVTVNNYEKSGVLKIPVSGGKPEVFLTDPIINPYRILVAPETFRGSNVNPGDLIVFDNAHGIKEKTAIWAIDRAARITRPIITHNPFTTGKGFLGGGFALNGILYAGLNTHKSDEVTILNINSNGSARVVFNNYYPVKQGIEKVDSHPIAVHPVTGELFFGAHNSLYAFYPQTTNPRLVTAISSTTLRWNQDGTKLYLIADQAIWTLSGPGIESQPVSMDQN